jgi:hypothetical protein
VARGFGALAARVRGAGGGAVEILAAHGRGRSYGIDSRFLWSRALGSIDACGLWPVLAARAAPTQALVCDVGNDLAYGVPQAVVAQWIERALDRLDAARASVVVVGLPLASLEQLGRVRFDVARGLLFPGRKLELRALLDAARALDERLATLARERRHAFVAPRAEWFGLDPVHVRAGARDAAWRACLAPLACGDAACAQPLSERLLLARRRPAVRRLFGREQRRAQPCVRFADGTSVAEY